MKGRILLLVLLFSHLVGWGVEGTIDTVEYVNFKPENWQGKEDLSFTYKLEIVDEAIELTVDVTDQTVLFKDGDTIVSDHVELWLFDPAILKEVQASREELDELLAVRKEFPAETESEREENQKIINTIKDQYKKIGNIKYVHQYIFNKSKITTSPVFQRNANITYSYTRAESGYAFRLIMPVVHSLSLKSEEINQLGYLISVSDIDSESVTKQEKLMSSERDARFNRPESFNVLDVELIIDINDPREFYQSFVEDGVFYLTEKGYEYIKKTFTSFSGLYPTDGGDIPSGYEKVEPYQVLSKDTLSLKFCGSSLLVEVGPQIQVIDIVEHIPGIYLDLWKRDCQIKESSYYILLGMRGDSALPSDGHCGAGREENLLFIALDKYLNIMQMKSELIESCFQDRYTEREEKADKLTYRYYDYGKDKDAVIVYDFNRPEEGLVVTETEPKK